MRFNLKMRMVFLSLAGRESCGWNCEDSAGDVPSTNGPQSNHGRVCLTNVRVVVAGKLIQSPMVQRTLATLHLIPTLRAWRLATMSLWRLVRVFLARCLFVHAYSRPRTLSQPTFALSLHGQAPSVASSRSLLAAQQLLLDRFALDSSALQHSLPRGYYHAAAAQ